MYLKHLLFECKVLLRNRKQWILGLFLILFFPLYFQHYLGTEPPTLADQKLEQKDEHDVILNVFPMELRDTSEGDEIYDNLTKQRSIIAFQVYYLRTVSGKKNDNYVGDGLELNELQLEMYEKGNPNIPDYLAMSKEEIDKDGTFLSYLQQHDIKQENNPLVASQFLIVMLKFLSGIMLFVAILLIGSDMLVYENDHPSVLQGLPISFVTKALSKLSLHYLFIIISLAIGVGAGVFRAFTDSGLGNMSYPVLVYTENGFEAISTFKYLSYALLAILIIVIMVLCLTLLLNIFLKHMYATVLVGLGIFVLPDLLHIIGINIPLLYPIKYIDFTAVLSGQIAEQYGKGYIDYWHSITWMAVFTVVLIAIIVLQNRLRFSRKGS